MMTVDWFAVECVVSGTQLALNVPERRAVIRRLEHRMRLPHVARWDAYGTLTAEDVAERMYVTPRSIQRMKEELPEADKRRCPVCGEDMWVWHNGIVEPHPDGLNQECPMSGEAEDEQTWESQTAMSIMWLSQRIRAGDYFGVWDYIAKLGDSEWRQLLMAALAAVPECEDPFDWLDPTRKDTAA